MLERIRDFARLLRDNGVRVSTAEILDAAAAVEAVGVHKPGAVRSALAATLIKNPADRATFEQLYDLYFHRFDVLAGAGAASDGPLTQLAGLDGVSDEATAALTDAMIDAAMALGAVARAAMGLGAPEMSSLIRAAEARVQLDDVRSPLQIGFYGYRMAEALGVGQVESDVLAWARATAIRLGLSDDATRDLEERIVSRFSDLRQRLRDFVGRSFDLANPNFTRDLALDALAEKPLVQLSEKEMAELRHEVTRLAELMRARLAQRPKPYRRGRLDLRRTLRASLGTGGIPFELVHRRRRRHKPRLLVLCDISDSVRVISRFMLQLVYTLQELFDRVQTFAFVAELGELTELFRQHELERAIELTYAGVVVSTFANSNYGRTLEQFVARHIDRVTRRTTVIVIGDGRNNYHASRAPLLGEIKRRAKQVLWLNPEPPPMWGFGDSAMREYEAHCDRVMVVRNLEGLRRVVDRLIMRSGLA